MTTNRDLKFSVVERIVGSLANLHTYGFSEPMVKRQDWSETISILLTNIALEIEIDWRDFDIFVMVVRLENGILPNGYYVSGGRPCRSHLQEVISERKWNVNRDDLAAISPESRGNRQHADRSADAMVDRFFAYKKVIDSCIVRLVAEESEIFKMENRSE